MQRWTDQTHSDSRRGYTLIELIVSIGSASVLTAGLASAVIVANGGLSAPESPDGQRLDASDVHRQLLSDLRHAQSFSERTDTAVTFTVPDRDGDGFPDTLRYAWSGPPNNLLEFSMNGGTSVTLAEDVQDFELSYLTQTLIAPTVIEDEGTNGSRLLFISGAIQLDAELSFFQLLAGEIAPTTTSAFEDDLISLFESWGYEVTKVAAEQTTLLQEELVSADVVYVSSEPLTASISPGVLASTTAGVVNAQEVHSSTFGFSSTVGDWDATGFDPTNTPHYITTGYPVDTWVTMLSSRGDGFSVDGTLSSDLTVLGTLGQSDAYGLVALYSGSTTYDARTVPGRRVQIPFPQSSSPVSALTADGQTILRNAVDWAAGAGEDPVDESNFGFDEVFTEAASGLRQTQLATQVKLFESGTVTSLTAYVGGQNSNVRLAIYADAGGEPGSLIAETAVANTTSAMQRLTIDLPDVPLPAGDYWLAIGLAHNNQQIVRTGGGQSRFLSHAAASSGFLANWGTSAQKGDSQISIYGSYIPD